MKKALTLLLVSVLAMTCLLGCSAGTAKKTVSYTFEVETGDTVKVSLSGTDYVLKQQDGLFMVDDKDGTTIATGIFISKDMYSSYHYMLIGDGMPSGVSNLTSGTRDNFDYVSYDYAEKDETNGDYHEHNFVGYIKDSNTGFILGSTSDITVVGPIFEALDFTLVKK